MTKTRISPRLRHEGFTLIELLIVIVVISILALMLTPTINKILVKADNRKSQAYVVKVTRAAEAYKGDNNGRYPGQDDALQLTGSGGPYTGSQVLAARLFDYPDTDIQDATLSDAPRAKSTYLEYKSYLLISQSSTGASIPKNSLGDDSKTLNALLYFPSRPN
ncbi:MAG: type II secretion system protein, partial [bacterium]|nr:type II secretion system protein [bacterium]